MTYKSNCNCVANNLTYALRTTETLGALGGNIIS